MILHSAGMKELFLEVLRRARIKYRFQLVNFCIMGNHYHLMIKPKDDSNLSRIMQWIMSVFAMAFNRIHGYVGHVWGSRFFSRIVCDLREFLKIHRYIDENPVDARLISEKRAWEYGGLWHHRSGRRDVCSKLIERADLMIPEHCVLCLPKI